jgi:hypothetical protein
MYTPGKLKEYIRNDIFLFLADCKYIITLPNLHFSLEENLIAKGCKIDCTEYKKDIYVKALKIKPKKVKLFNNNIKDLNLSLYDGLFLDLCGIWNEDMQEVLPQIKIGAKIVFTFLMARDSKRLQQIINITKREESYVMLLKQYGFKTIKYINYRDTTPMCVFYCIKIK